MDDQQPRPDNSQHRVDASHRGPLVEPTLDVKEETSAELVAAAAGVSAAHREEQTELQGHQLMMDLARRQREIDRREAQFNAFLATLDRESRTQRVKQSEREQQLHQREQEFHVRMTDLAQREAALHNDQETGGNLDDAQLRKLRHELEEKRIRLAAEENALRFRWQKMQAQREASMQLVRHLMRSVEQRREALELQGASQPDSPSTNATPSDLDKLASELDRRHQELVASQAEVTAERRRLEKLQTQLQTDRQEWDSTRRREEERIGKQKSIDRAEREQHQELLQRRGEELSKRQAALDQMQANVTRTHREALELRLATEQLWSQLGEKISPQELADTLGQLRAKLNEHYETAADGLSKRRDELQTMAIRLDEQQSRLGEDRAELQSWFDRRNEEIEFQAARLVAREQELESHAAQNSLLRKQWEEQRHEYEDEIRRLRSQLNRRDLSAA